MRHDILRRLPRKTVVSVAFLVLRRRSLSSYSQAEALEGLNVAITSLGTGWSAQIWSGEWGQTSWFICGIASPNLEQIATREDGHHWFTVSQGCCSCDIVRLVVIENIDVLKHNQCLKFKKWPWEFTRSRLSMGRTGCASRDAVPTSASSSWYQSLSLFPYFFSDLWFMHS